MVLASLGALAIEGLWLLPVALGMVKMGMCGPTNVAGEVWMTWWGLFHLPAFLVAAPFCALGSEAVAALAFLAAHMALSTMALHAWIMHQPRPRRRRGMPCAA